jgi:hypothetical protein
MWSDDFNMIREETAVACLSRCLTFAGRSQGKHGTRVRVARTSHAELWFQNCVP